MKNIFVTGATGFVGSHLVTALLDKGYAVSLLVRRENALIDGFRKRGAVIYNGSIDDTDFIEKAVKSSDTVIHLAGATKGVNEKEYLTANAEYAKKLFSAVKNGTKIIYVSSQAAGGPSTITSPRTENMPDNPLTYYGKSKRLGEIYLEEWGETHNNNYIILRPCSIYGPGEKDIFTYFKLVSRGFLLLLGSGEKKFSVIHVADVVSAIIASAESTTKGETFYLSNDTGVSWLEFSSMITRAMEKEKVLTVRLPEWAAYPIGFTSDMIARIIRKPALLNNQKLIEMKQDAWLCSNEKIRQKLGWTPSLSLEQGLRSTAEWYKKEGWV